MKITLKAGTVTINGLTISAPHPVTLEFPPPKDLDDVGLTIYPMEMEKEKDLREHMDNQFNSWSIDYDACGGFVKVVTSTAVPDYLMEMISKEYRYSRIEYRIFQPF